MINLTSGFVWSDDGCQTTQFENGSVLCSCNHLTHFAILLSPGVEVREEEFMWMYLNHELSLPTDRSSAHSSTNNYRTSVCISVTSVPASYYYYLCY